MQRFPSCPHSLLQMGCIAMLSLFPARRGARWGPQLRSFPPRQSIILIISSNRCTLRKTGWTLRLWEPATHLQKLAGKRGPCLPGSLPKHLQKILCFTDRGCARSVCGRDVPESMPRITDCIFKQILCRAISSPMYLISLKIHSASAQC